MLPGEESDQRSHDARDDTGTDEHAGPRQSIRRGRRVRYTHELSDESSEAMSRTLIRLVPLAYGVMLGALSDRLWLGLSAGLVSSAAFDVYMGRHSLIRSAFRRLLKPACLVVSAISGGFAALIGFVGLPVPSVLREMECEKGRGSF